MYYLLKYTKIFATMTLAVLCASITTGCRDNLPDSLPAQAADVESSAVQKQESKLHSETSKKNKESHPSETHSTSEKETDVSKLTQNSTSSEQNSKDKSSDNSQMDEKQKQSSTESPIKSKETTTQSKTSHLTQENTAINETPQTEQSSASKITEAPQKKSSSPTPSPNENISYERKSSSTHIIINDEMRAVWVPYLTLDISRNGGDEATFQTKINDIINTCLDYKLNTIIVHVRPFGDAIYPSDYFPASHIISGTQGIGVEYDPLQYIVDAAHSNGLSVQAWVNPFRISNGSSPWNLADSNPYIKWKNDSDESNDDYTFNYNGGIYYNPAYPEVRKLIIDGIAEIVRNYDVDGIQMDDYFYPSEETFYDEQTYNSYINSIENGYSGLSHQEWRKTNVNTLISGIYTAVHSIDNSVVFGIAPQCNFDNNNKISADVITWCSTRGYIDYICPQIYVSNQHPTFPFEGLAHRWKDTVTENSVKLYFGLGVYKAGTDADSGTWLLSDDNIKTQIELGRALGINGFMLYSYDYLNSSTTSKEMSNARSVID